MNNKNKGTNLYRFFDHIGVVVFLFIFVNSLRNLYLGNASWDTYVYLLIGLSGFCIDGYLVFFYKRKDN